MRTLALDLGNTTLFCGVFDGSRLLRRFRVPAASAARRFESLVAGRVGRLIDAAVLCSVVPPLTEPLARAVRRSFRVDPVIVHPRGPHGLKIRYRRPDRLGADRVAAALGARRLFPRRDVIVVDCGTATTVTALGRDGTLLGGAILPGMALWGRMLAAKTAQLPEVPARRPRTAVGRSPEEAIAAGNWIGHAGAVREVVRRIQMEAFRAGRAVVVGTGGHAAALAGEGLLSVYEPDLILYGLNAYVLGKADS